MRRGYQRPLSRHVRRYRRACRGPRGAAVRGRHVELLGWRTPGPRSDISDVRRAGPTRRMCRVIMVLLALLMGLGVMFGMQAVVVDMGYGMGQHGAMQNAADAGA